MNPYPTDLAKAAAYWLTALQDDPENSEIVGGFRVWLGKSAAHAEAWNEILDTYEVLGEIGPSFRRKWSSSDLVQPKSNRGQWMLFSALAACVAVSFLLLIKPSNTPAFETEIGETLTTILSDGSEITLAPLTTLDVDFTDSERSISLSNGIAYFDVTTDKSRPFRVTAGSIRATALGTAFVISAREESRGSVAVHHGRVGVALDGAEDYAGILEDGDKLSLVGDAQFALSRVAANDIGAWTRGQLIANGHTFQEVIDFIQPYVSQKISLGDPDLAQRRITGVYDLKNPREALDAVAAGLGANLVFVSEEEILLTR
ncbi:MAG: FecR domain-containing protein [Verrucomicrobiota bacterium]